MTVSQFYLQRNSIRMPFWTSWELECGEQKHFYESELKQTHP